MMKAERKERAWVKKKYLKTLAEQQDRIHVLELED